MILNMYIFLLIHYAFNIYFYALLVYCIAGFLIQNRHAPWYIFLHEMIDPSLTLIRRLTRNKLVIERIDLSPLVLMLLLQVIEKVIGRLLLGSA